MLKNTKEIVEERKEKKGTESEIKDLKKAIEKITGECQRYWDNGTGNQGTGKEK